MTLINIIQFSRIGLLVFLPFAMFGYSLHPVVGAIGILGFIGCIAILLAFFIWVTKDA